MLVEAFYAVYERDHAAEWLRLNDRALTALHDRARDDRGFYADNWATDLRTEHRTVKKVSLLYQASAARAFLVAARYSHTNENLLKPARKDDNADALPF
jgi:hypothetical protein